MDNDCRTIIRDYLNDMYKEEEIMNIFDLKKCECGIFELEEDMVDTEGMINGGIGDICQSCKENM